MMKFGAAAHEPIQGDMTPMIDMTFQLIAFFMLLLNFGEGEQDERIRLPLSELAKPPETASVHPITLQLTRSGTVIVSGEEISTADVKPLLLRERRLLERLEEDPKQATIIIRADADAKTGLVQALIKDCQEAGFEKFVLRAKQKEI
jgi:biopolymer transport protein ExbD